MFNLSKQPCTYSNVGKITFSNKIKENQTLHTSMAEI